MRSDGLDMVTFKSAVCGPRPNMVPNAAEAVVAIDADFIVQVGSSVRKVVQLEGYPKGVRITLTATAVKEGA